MNAMKKIYLLLICEGFYLGSVCQEWTFPSKVTALIGSCVEIPCTYRPAGTSGTSSTVWYLYKYWENQRHPDILNTGDSSSVMAEYRDRTSLVPGENSCTLRIDPVRRGDDEYYYPGITGDRNMNAYKKQSKGVQLYVTEKVNIQLYLLKLMTEGKANTIRCTAEHTCRSSPPSIQLNKPGQIQNKSMDKYGGNWREESELTYIPSYVDDGSPVRCTVTYPNGEEYEVSVTLNIEYTPKNVTVAVKGTDEVMEGTDVTLQCNSLSKPGVYVYEWYKGKTKLPDRRREITVRKVTWDMEPYSCAARNDLGRGVSAPTEIPVLYAPKNVTVTVKGTDEVMEGNDATLQCNSFSKPDVYEYEWYKGKTKLPDRGREITVRNVTRDMEPYSCAAINHLGRGESAPTEIPVLFSITGSNIKIRKKHGVTELICEVLSSRPDVTHYIWMKDGSILTNETGKTLTINNTDENYRKYSCSPHDSTEDSSLEEPFVKSDSPDLPLILGTVAGVFGLLFLILFIFFYLRRKKKSALPTSPIHGTLSSKKSTAKDESQYGNIQSNHLVDPHSMRSDDPVDMNVDENYVIYSNSETLQPSYEVEYSTIAHGQPPPTSSRVRNVEDVEYATLKQ